MSSKFEIIENFINNIFASRAKVPSETFLSVWIREISTKAPDVQILSEVEKSFCMDDELPLTIAQICRMIDENKIKFLKKSLPKISNCPYCGGKGLVYNTLRFDKFGKLITENVALLCFCAEENKLQLTRMNHDETTNNRTVLKNGDYFLAFPSIVEKEQYKKNLEFVRAKQVAEEDGDEVIEFA